jgi:glutamyl-tRNA synthetase
MGHTAESGYLQKIVPLLKPRAKTMREMAEMAEFFLFADEKLPYDKKAVDKFLTPESRDCLQAIRQRLGDVSEFSQKNLEDTIAAYLEESGLKFKKLAQPLRVAITGKTFSPGLFETMEVLGQEKTLNRLDRACSMQV